MPLNFSITEFLLGKRKVVRNFFEISRTFRINYVLCKTNKMRNYMNSKSLNWFNNLLRSVGQCYYVNVTTDGSLPSCLRLVAIEFGKYSLDFKLPAPIFHYF